MPSSHYAVRNELFAERTVEMKLGGPRPRLQRGTRIVVFVRKAGTIYFIGTGSVISARIRGEGPGESEERINQLEFSELQPFDSPRPLTEIAGSLRRVYRFLNAEKHFARQVNALSGDDLNTIVSYKLHVPRSVFRYLFSSLPLAVQSEFVRTYPRSFPRTAAGYVTTYKELAGELLTFLEERAREPLRLVSDLEHVYRHLPSDSVPPLASLYLARDEEQSGIAGDGRVGLIAFGSQVQAVAELFNTNALFGNGNDGRALLNECVRELEAFDEVEPKWRDPIF